MPKGRQFSLFEEELLVDNYDLTIAELEALLAKHGYPRTRKSINRKLEKLRAEGQVGLRSRDTVKRAYKQRRRNKAEPTKLDDSLDNGNGWDDDSSLGDPNDSLGDSDW